MAGANSCHGIAGVELVYYFFRIMFRVIIHGFNKIVESSIAYLKDDYTELWFIVHEIVEENPQLTFEELILATQDILSYLFETNRIVLIDTRSIKPIIIEKDDLLVMVKDKFIELGKAPEMGDGIWLSIEEE